MKNFTNNKTRYKNSHPIPNEEDLISKVIEKNLESITKESLEKITALKKENCNLISITKIASLLHIEPKDYHTFEKIIQEKPYFINSNKLEKDEQEYDENWGLEEQENKKYISKEEFYKYTVIDVLPLVKP